MFECNEIAIYSTHRAFRHFPPQKFAVCAPSAYHWVPVDLSSAFPSASMTERTAILRAIDGRTAAGATQQFFLRVARDGDGTLTLTLCDGRTTWRGLLTVAPALGAAFPEAHGTHVLAPKRSLDRPGASGGAVPLRAASQTRHRHFEPARWGGAVTDAALTPPKMGMRHADFAERLLDGLQGAAGTEADAFGVTELHDG